MAFVSARWLRTPHRKRTSASKVLISIMIVVLAMAIIGPQKAHADTLLATATLDATTSTSQLLSPIPVGINTAAWDSNMQDASYPGLLNAAGVQIMRFPGGGTADNYVWESASAYDPTLGTAGANTFDTFMNVVQQASSQAMITVNYGSATAQNAADWVSYANMYGANYTPNYPWPSYPDASPNGHGYGIKYWEIGNETYGDGGYGSPAFEPNLNCSNPLSHCGPSDYAAGVNAYSQAMRAVDPSIKIGAVLTAPGNYPDGLTNPNSSPKPWNDTVLSQACDSIDFVDVHWYPQAPLSSGFPGTENDANLLGSAQNGIPGRTPGIAAMISRLRSKINQYCSDPNNVQIMVTETNSVYATPGKQTTSIVNALFMDDNMMTWLENGVANVDWWAGHNSPSDGNNSSSLAGNYNFGDYGILSTGQCSDAGYCEPPAETPFPAYYGLQMLNNVMGPAVAATNTPYFPGVSSSTSNVAVHATTVVLSGTGYNQWATNVLFINKDLNNTYDEILSLPKNLRAGGIATVSTYDQNSTAISQSTMVVSGSSIEIFLSPYSLTVVNFSEFFD